jgi:polysaccharide biosynthesis transport protein
MSFAQFLSILRARWRSALAMLLTTVTLVVVVSLVMPKKYTAGAAIVVDVRSPDPVAGVAPISLTIPNYMATQLDIMNSNRVARKVVQNLKLTQSTQLREQWQEDTDGRGESDGFEGWVAEKIQLNLRVKTTRESNVININYRSADAKFSAMLANAFVAAYIETNRDLRVDPAKANNTFFDERARQMRTELEAAQARMSGYQREKGLTANDERLDVETARLNELSTQLVAIQAVSAESRGREGQARAGAAQMTEVLNNPLVSGLKSELSRQEAKLQELNSRLGDAHPQVIELRASIGDTRKKVDAEIRRVSSSLGINASVNRSREGEVKAALEAQRNRVLKLKSERDELAVQQRDVDSAQKAYDAVLLRATQTGLESQSQLTNISVLNPAEVPVKPSSPLIFMNTALALFLGSFLGVGLALLRELMDRRVRTASDIVKSLDLPVIGTMPAPSRRALLGGHRRALPQRVLGRLPGPGVASSA